jgi:hypothetical protein
MGADTVRPSRYADEVKRCERSSPAGRGCKLASMLTTSERIHLKKRVIEKLAGEKRLEVDLTLDEYGFESSESMESDRAYVLARIAHAPDDQLEGLDRHLFPERYTDATLSLGDLYDDENNAPFTPAEQQRVAEVLGEIKRQAGEQYGVTEEQLTVLNAKLDVLIGASSHSRRKEWLLVASSVIGGPFAGGALTPEVVQKVFMAIEAGLGAMFGHAMPLLRPGGG